MSTRPRSSDQATPPRGGHHGHLPTVDDIYDVLERDGKRPVLLYIKGKQKGASLWKDWPDTTYEETLDEDYQRLLEEHANTGVLLGVDDLCTIDCDTDAFLEAFLAANPLFRDTLTTRGQRGAQLWFYCPGGRPRKAKTALLAKSDSPLAAGTKQPVDKDGKPIETPIVK